MCWKGCSRVGLLPLILFIMAIPSIQGECPLAEWKRNGANCYWVSGERRGGGGNPKGGERKRSQTVARKDCQSKSAELTSIEDAQEVTFLKKITKDNEKYWIGLMANGPRKTYWLDGSKSTYRYWASGEPNNNGVCFGMDFHPSQGGFFDEDCSQALLYICKRVIEIRHTTTKVRILTTRTSTLMRNHNTISDETASKATGFTATTTTTLSSNDSLGSGRKTDSDTSETNVGLAVGVSVGLFLLLLVAVVVIVVIIWRRRHPKHGYGGQSSHPYQSVDGRQPIPHVYQIMTIGATSGESNYEDLTETSTPPAATVVGIYDNRPATSAPGSHQSPYDNGETTPVDYALYRGEIGTLPRPPNGYEDMGAFRLNAAAASAHHPVYNGDETTLTDYALYEKETRSPDDYEDMDRAHANTSAAASHQQPVYSDRDTTLVDNTLYGSEA